MSHSVTDHTQGNWNGAVGKMELRAQAQWRISTLRVETENRGLVSLEITLNRPVNAATHGNITTSIHEYPGGHELVRRTLPLAALDSGKISLQLPEPPLLWSEFTPALYQVRTSLQTGQDGESVETVFGFREIRNQGGRLELNGRRIFLRGTLECCIFPLTGHPPTEKEPWVRIFRIASPMG